MNNKIQRSRNPISEKEIDDLEKTINYILPKDYRSFLLRHNGGLPDARFFTIEGNPSDDHGMIQFLFCICEGDIYDLGMWYLRYLGRLPVGSLPIGVDPGGNIICLSLADESYGRIYFWEHESESQGESESGLDNLFLISRSFSDFIHGLKLSIE